MNKSFNKNTLTQNSFTNFAYNGMKLDNEVSGNGNSYTAEFWQMDSRLGRRWNRDPLENKFPWQAPYTIFDNNPIIKIDPTGESAGDYYSKEGKHLGNDGIKDDKVYVTDQKTIESATENKKVNWKEVKESKSTNDLSANYGIKHSHLLDRANWIYAEGGYKIPEYYAYTIENAYLDKTIGNKSESKVYYWLLQDESGRLDKDKYFSGSYSNKTGKAFWNLRNTPEKFNADMNNTIEAVIKSKIYPEKDPTGGTNAWLGYKSGNHTGDYYINSLGSRHFFQRFGKSKITSLEKKYITVE